MQFLDLPFWRQALRGIMAMLCNLIYSVMSFFYDLFNNISQINILTSTDVQPIYQRVTMILTIVMVFYITFQFVKYVVQPDAMTDKEKGAGNIVYKMVIVIVLIAFVPKIFEMAYDVQNAIISKNVISKVILGPQASMDEENLGAGFAASVFNMFYYAAPENINEDCYDGAECGLLVIQNIGTLKTEGNLNSVSLGLNETDNSDTPLITFEFDGLLAVIVGGLIVYILILYCIDVGVRWVQLLYLQLIAPIPILGYITPKKDGIFQKWVKQCTTTYLDLFLRVAIINIILLLCDTLLKSKIAGDLVPEGSSTMMTTLIYVVLIMAVMLFAHKAPKMLAELFPKGGAASGNFGIGWKDASARVAPEVASMAGAALGSTRMLGGLASRAINRHRRNVANNAHSILTKEGREQARQRRENQNRVNQMKNDMKLTQAANAGKKRVSDEQINDSKNRVRSAQQNLENAKRNGTQTDIAQAEALLKKETSNYRTLMQQRNNLGGVNRFSNNALNREIQNAQQKHKQAEKELADARNSGDQKAIKRAQDKVDATKAELDSQVERFQGIRKGDVDKAQANLEEAQWQVAKDNNEKHGSVVGAALTGAVSGLVTGVKEGSKAKKLEEIIPKAQEGWKKDIKHEQELNKYYDNGGAVGIQGTIERAITHAEKSIGIDTEYAKTIMSTKPLESKIKDLDAKMSLTKDVSSTVGSGEDRLNSKIYDLKNMATPNSIKTGLKDALGNDIKADVKPNQTIGDLAREYDARAEVSKNEAESSAKRAEEAEKQGITGQALDALKAEAAQKAKKAEDDKYAAAQVKKNAAREAYTQILKRINIDNNPEGEKTFDQVAVQNIRDAQRSIKLATQEPELREKVKEKLTTTFGLPEGNRLYNAFISGIITSYDDIDAIKTAVINAQNEYSRDRKDLQERKRKIETSDLAQAQKAANDYSGNNGR